MQQTETYKLNLIESSDPFLPNALNENTRKIEEVVQEKLGEMDARVTVLEGFKFACGSFRADRDPQIIELGFTPKAVYIHRQMPEYTDAHILITGDTTANIYLCIVEGGFRHHPSAGSYLRNGIYHYIAFG